LPTGRSLIFQRMWLESSVPMAVANPILWMPSVGCSASRRPSSCAQRAWPASFSMAPKAAKPPAWRKSRWPLSTIAVCCRWSTKRSPSNASCTKMAAASTSSTASNAALKTSPIYWSIRAWAPIPTPLLPSAWWTTSFKTKTTHASNSLNKLLAFPNTKAAKRKPTPNSALPKPTWTASKICCLKLKKI